MQARCMSQYMCTHAWLCLYSNLCLYVLLSFSKQLHRFPVYCTHLTALMCPLQNRYMATIGLCSKKVSTRYSCMKFQHLHTFILPVHRTVQNNRDTSQSIKIAALSKNVNINVVLAAGVSYRIYYTVRSSCWLCWSRVWLLLTLCERHTL